MTRDDDPGDEAFTGPAYRQQPDAPHIVQRLSRDGRVWLSEATCQSARLAQWWMWRRVAADLKQRQETPE